MDRPRLANRPRFHALSADAVRCQARGIDDRDGRSGGGILFVEEKILVGWQGYFVIHFYCPIVAASIARQRKIKKLMIFSRDHNADGCVQS
jgi:hypothetical protein